MVDDFDLIVASITAQYGIRMYGNDFRTMKWAEFHALLCGLGPDTPLGRIVSIRAEDDVEVIKSFSKEQKKVRNNWRKRMANSVSKETMDDILEQLKKAFISMAGGINAEESQNN